MEGRAFRVAPALARVVAYAAALGAIALVVLALRGPTLRNFAPYAQRLFWFHVPMAMLAYATFAATLVASVAYLSTRRARWDLLAAASAEVGVLLATLTVVTGIAWARVDFPGYRPLADPKLVSVVALALVYAAYLALRRGVPEESRRARLAAVFGIVAFLAVPVAYLATYVGSVHPEPAAVEGVRGGLALALALAAPLAAHLVLTRMRILDLERRAAHLAEA